MYRKQLLFLKDWYEKKDRKPLIVRGARQVGKSTLIKLFAEQLGSELAEVNLERHVNLNKVFTSKNPKAILSELEDLLEVSITGKSILFLDEIQSTPEAIPALRYFYEETGLPIVGAGSLLEFVLSHHKFSMPVGRINYLHMGPLLFSEFLNAMGEERLLVKLGGYKLGASLTTALHEKYSETLRQFLFVGGMPEAVKHFAMSQNFKDASEVHRSILDTYQEDFPKYIGSRDAARVLNVFNYAARSVGQKVKYANFARDEQSVTIKKDIELLSLARVISKVTHSSCNGLPLQAENDPRVYKLLFLDVGLVNSLLGLNWTNIRSFSGTQLVNEGPIAEQFVGQHLLDYLSDKANRGLNYWLREGKGKNAEVDYVISLGGKIVPIEVKSGSSGALRSLHQFMGEKSLPVAIRLDTNKPSVQKIETFYRVGTDKRPVSYTLITLPLYLVEKIPEVVEDWYS